MFRIVTLIAVLALTGVPETVCAQTGSVRMVPGSRTLSRFGLERAFWSHATVDIYRDHLRHMVLDDSNLYLQSSGGVVTAIDNETGQKRWALQLGRQDEPSYPATSNDEIVLIIAGITMYAVDPITGELQWKLLLRNQPSTSPTIDRNYVYFGTLDGSVYAYDVKKIRELHEKNQLPQFSKVAEHWRYKSAKEITTPIVSDGLTINFASRDKSLYSLTAVSRELQFQFETDEEVSAPLGISGRVVFFASEDFSLFAIDRQSGTVRWRFVTGRPIRQQPRVVGENVYVMPVRGGMYCLDRVSGRRLWWQPVITEYVGATRSLVFGSDRLNNLVVMSRIDGAIIGALPLRDFTVRYGNELTDRLYLSTSRGLVICLRENGREFPIYHRYPERQPILPEFAPEEDPAAAGT